MAYDEARGVSVLFGGWSATGVRTNDTWTYDGTSWTQATTAVSPTGRARTSLAYDSARSVVVMFGGEGPGGGNRLGDTWEWDGTVWLQRAPLSSPSPRWNVHLAYDRQRARTVLFGGNTASGVVNDVWEWDGTNWAQVPTVAGPSLQNQQFGLVFDEDRQVCVLLAGSYGSTETWEWDGVTWLRTTVTSNTSYRHHFGFAYDSVRRRVVVHGGLGGNVGQIRLSDTIEYDGVQWFAWTSTLSRQETAICFDRGRQQLVLFGGSTAGTGHLAETWEFAHPGPAPVTRFFGAACAGQFGLAIIDPASQSGGSVPAIGQTFKVRVGRTAGGSLVFLTIGTNTATWNGLPLPLDLGLVGAAGCWLHTDPVVFVAATAGIQNTGVIPVPIPNDSNLLGNPVYMQGLAYAPTTNTFGWITGNGMECRFGQ